MLLFSDIEKFFIVHKMPMKTFEKSKIVLFEVPIQKILNTKI